MNKLDIDIEPITLNEGINKLEDCKFIVNNISNSSSINIDNSLLQLLGYNSNPFNYSKIVDDLTTLLGNLKKTRELIIKLDPIWYYLESIKNGNFEFGEEVAELIISVFSNNENQYGSNQSSAYNLFEKYLRGDDLTQQEQEKIKYMKKIFAEKANIEDSDNLIDFILFQAMMLGCGYAVITNIIADKYTNMENGYELFKEDYGYPLYYNNNGVIEYNFELLFTDLYVSSSNFNAINTLDNLSQMYPTYGWGMDLFRSLGLDEVGNQINLEYLIAMGSRDIKTSSMDEMFVTLLSQNFSNSSSVVLQNDLSVETYNEYINDYDYAAISAFNYELKPYGNNISDRNISNVSGHWMLITGISENGNYIVSSWGNEWELISSKSTPYVIGKVEIPSLNNGGLVFFNVGDYNEN